MLIAVLTETALKIYVLLSTKFQNFDNCHTKRPRSAFLLSLRHSHFPDSPWCLFQVKHSIQTREVHYVLLFLWGCCCHLPFSYRSKPSSNSTVYHYQPILQAGILQSKMEVGEILAPVNMSSPVSLVGSSGNQVAPPDSYAMFRHLMEAKVTHKRWSSMN